MSYRAVDYETKLGKSRFRQWHAKLTGKEAAIIDVAVRKLEFGNFNSAKNIKDGVYECSVDTGPGYRVYYGLDWKEYKHRKAAEDKQKKTQVEPKNRRHNRRKGDK